MRTFKKLRGVDLPYNKQGEIYFVCQNYRGQPKKVRDKIDRLCREIGREYADALFEMVTTDKGCTAIAMEHYMSEMTLYKLRRRFYERW